MTTDFRPIMQALFEHLKAAAIIDFVADAAAGEDTLTDVDRADLLFPGLPVFGPGMAEGVMIQSVDVEARTVTLSEPVWKAALRWISAPGF
jgi:Cu/Ag efflux protein CusF